MAHAAIVSLISHCVARGRFAASTFASCMGRCNSVVTCSMVSRLTSGSPAGRPSPIKNPI